MSAAVDERAHLGVYRIYREDIASSTGKRYERHAAVAESDFGGLVWCRYRGRDRDDLQLRDVVETYRRTGQPFVSGASAAMGLRRG